ncbi:uncharacterized protein CCOS01_05664 [Colletotrichum costaricense]|uniref:Uncharacterized protein n=1 Tax=Colletotrichum costaricense TaxID=1209916 RepID=A0AAJ0E223_9PEZI|nr:uncharacterized protein CCOS01_05664 [Colletotrichum costaricense]KAK1530561.1 hypothetical protein CCOS01_05664 [Colletotrichum costaricense]
MCRPNSSCPVGPLHTNNDAYREGSTCRSFTPTFVIGFAGHFPESTSPEGIIRYPLLYAYYRHGEGICGVRRATCDVPLQKTWRARINSPNLFGFVPLFLLASCPFLCVSRLLLAAFLDTERHVKSEQSPTDLASLLHLLTGNQQRSCLARLSPDQDSKDHLSTTRQM